MNILYLTTHLNTGGITSYLLSLSTCMKQQGHNIYVASSGGELTEEFKHRGAQFFSIPIKTKSEVSPKIIISLFKLLKFISQNNIEIIHSNTRVTQVLGCLLGSFLHKPYISTCHGFFKKRFSRKIFGCWGKRVIAISQPVKEHLINDFGVSPRKIRVVHNGIDINKFQISCLSGRQADFKFQIEAKKKFGLKDAMVVGIVARLSAVKGHVYLIEAMKIVLEKFPNAQLLIVGDGNIKEELAKLVERLNLGKNILFVPSQRDTAEVLLAMDVFAMPSLEEGLGLGLMEAMASGLAVVASDVGGIKSLIQHGYNGLLVKRGDSGGLAQAIVGLFSDNKKREFLGNNAQDFINKNFSLNKMILETERVYQECLSSVEY